MNGAVPVSKRFIIALGGAVFLSLGLSVAYGVHLYRMTPEAASTLVQFADESSKRKFLAANGLADEDLEYVPAVGSYVVDRPASLLSKISSEVRLAPNQRYSALLTPNDPIYPQWYTNKISAAPAWDITTGSSAVTVAVIDTGYALSHEDLAGRWAENTGEKGPTASEGAAPNCTSRLLALDKNCNNLDDDGNGYKDDWRGWDFVNNDNDPIVGSVDPNGAYVTHGTVVAGLVGATGNNGKGVAGPNWGSKILPIQALGDDGVGYTSSIASAIRYAADRGVKVISLSLGSDSPDDTMRQQIGYAIGKGATVVAAAGNGGCNCMVYPANYPEVIAVGATDENDNRASFSSYGANLDLVAPGAGTIRTTYWSSANPTSLYTASANGTSISTPIVSGAAALLHSTKPGLSAEDVAYYLKASADNVSGMNGADRTDLYGDGRLNAHQALIQPTKQGRPLYRLYKRSTDRHFYTLNTNERDDALKNGFTLEGVAYYINYVQESGLVPIYRLYSRSRDYHFYTISPEERDRATGIGFTYEGVGFYAGTSSAGNRVAVYRLVNTNGRHMFTISTDERDRATGYGWKFEGIAYYAGI